MEGKDQTNQRTEGDRGTPMKICVPVLALIVDGDFVCREHAQPAVPPDAEERAAGELSVLPPQPESAPVIRITEHLVRQMNVKVEVELSSSPTEVDREDMLASATYLTNDKKSVVVYIPDDMQNTIVAEFTINKARQMDVVDGIGKRFRCNVIHYSQCSHILSRYWANESSGSKKPLYTQTGPVPVVHILLHEAERSSTSGSRHAKVFQNHASHCP